MKRILRWVYRAKYRLLGRRMGQPEAPPTLERGLVLIQIDGLSFLHLQRALQEGRMPYLARQIRKGRFQVAPWFAGFPTTTPVVTAALLYGQLDAIPGFRWYERMRKEPVVMKRPAHVRRVAARLRSDGGGGLLRGGACYASMFDGGAERTIFTLSTMGLPGLLSGVQGLGLFLMVLLNPGRIWRILRMVARDILDELWYGIRSWETWWRFLRDPTGLFRTAFLALGSALLHELLTFSLSMDIHRGISPLYAIYVLYDEAAHRYGPDHPVAFRALRRLDAYLREIDRMAGFARRPYDLYIFSDHGMTPSEPFARRFGRSLGDFVQEHMVQPVTLDETVEPDDRRWRSWRYLMVEMRGLERTLSPRSAQVVRAARAYVQRQAPRPREGEGGPSGRRADVVVRASGPLAHLYITAASHPLSLSEIAVQWPHLLDALIEHPGIGLVIGREGEDVFLMGRQGAHVIRADGRSSIYGQDPLTDPERMAPEGRWLDGERIVQELARLARLPDSGDLILLGAWDGQTVITFEDQRGTHGGLGGAQEIAFLVFPSDRPLRPQRWRDARDFHAYLTETYQRTPASHSMPD
ncbi:alkaline phosphatase family protein [Thermoflexus sp.]|uniref:alkaline phosphatase family protein n=1 Tax=Thermoflexus sp. TaxID=1969742 RepID=UPI002ADD6EB8|nr:alkaline phosphatase family protein [Thermoflexus sp.]